jgi:hypothetical protein
VIWGTPTTSHCGHSDTVILTVSNPRTRATIKSVKFMSNCGAELYRETSKSTSFLSFHKESNVIISFL